METKLDKYEEDIENNFEKQSKILNPEHWMEQFKESAIKHQKRR
jgi:predicted DNA binding CopG/RHH family protein